MPPIVRKSTPSSKTKHQDVAAFIPLDRFDPDVQQVGKVLKKYTITSNCSFSTIIHVPPSELISALTGDHTSHVTNKMLYQEVIKRLSDGETIAFWSYMIDQVKSCDLALRLKVERSDDDEITIRVSSVREEGENERRNTFSCTANPSNLPTPSDLEETLPNPHPTATKKLRLLLNNGTILLRKLPFGQTSFTFTLRLKLAKS